MPAYKMLLIEARDIKMLLHTRSSLVQIQVGRLFDAKPVSNKYCFCQRDHISKKFIQNSYILNRLQISWILRYIFILSIWWLVRLTTLYSIHAWVKGPRHAVQHNCSIPKQKWCLDNHFQETMSGDKRYSETLRHRYFNAYIFVNDGTV